MHNKEISGRSRRKKSGHKRNLIILLFFFILAVIILLAGVYISYHHLTTTHYEVTSSKLTSPANLVFLSDLHDHEFKESNQQLISEIEGLDPDAILLAGDLLNRDSEDSHIAVELISRLSEIDPVYISYGNQEMEYMERTGEDLKNIFENAGATVLDEEYTDICINGNEIRIGGLYGYAFALDGNNTTKQENMRSDRCRFLTDFQSTDHFRLMMVHRPDSVIFGDAPHTWNMDLAVSGHVHGGQVRLPFLGGLYGGDQGWFPEYDGGLYSLDCIENLIVTRGLSASSQKLPRFNNPPEIVLIHLEPDEES